MLEAQKNPPITLLLNLRQSMPAVKYFRDNKPKGELEIFRKQLILQQRGLLYSSAKKKMRTYKLIFAGLAAFFFFLAACLWGHSIPLASGLLSLSQAILLKNVMAGVCALFGGAALFISALLRTDRDVAAHLTRKARQHLMRHYTRKKVELGLTRLLYFGSAYTTSVALKAAYRAAVEKVHDHHEEILQLFEHIAHCSAMNYRSREHLYNQALTELNQKLQGIIESFIDEI
jgi:hypothetical protein